MTAKRRVSQARLEAAVSTLIDVSTFAEDLTGFDRDEIGHVIHLLNQLIDKGGVR